MGAPRGRIIGKDMNEQQFYTLVAIPLVGILMNGALFLYLGGRIDKLIDAFHALDKRVTTIEVNSRQQ